MHLTQLRLRDFRNYAALDASFGPGTHLFLGKNAQGKTNILEAIYLLATLRSFRGVGGAQMVRHGQKGYFTGGTVLSEQEHRIKMYWSASERKLALDGQPVRKLSDYLGVLRVVVFCTEDLLLVKGPGRVRRRFLDLLLTQTHRGYLALLQRYTTALRSRNALLKSRSPDPAALQSFSRQLVESGEEIIRLRSALVPQLTPLVQESYRTIAGAGEELGLFYNATVKADFAVALAQSRSRESALRSTLVGPHRDDLELRLDDRLAAAYSSEGQKRSLAIALKMAQALYLRNLAGISPILLIDDVLGELDSDRRAGFLPLLGVGGSRPGQVFITATEQNWAGEIAGPVEKWRVVAGTLGKAEGTRQKAKMGDDEP